MEVYLLRHPPIKDGVGICFGQTDMPLIESWGTYARNLKRELPKNLIVYSSDLSRCRMVADTIAEKKTHLRSTLARTSFWKLGGQSLERPSHRSGFSLESRIEHLLPPRR